MSVSPVPIPDLSAFEERSFSAKRPATHAKLTCPSPPLKSPPVSRVFSHRPASLCTPHAQPILINTPHPPAITPSQKMSLTPDTPSGTFFEDEFESLGLLGSGSFGEVWKVRSKSNGQVYAIKKSRHPFRSLKDRQRALSEVENVAKLGRHKHCVSYEVAWEQNGYLYIQMELCNSSLKDFLDEQPTISENQIWDFLLDISLGIKHIHDHNLVHLDIKPANIFFSSSGDNLKIGDFGLTFQYGSWDAEIEGDSMYLAPELLREEPALVGPPADIFSMGITMFEMAAGVELPSCGPLWHQLRSGNLHFPRPISQELEHVIRWMMSPDPGLRPSAGALMGQTALHNRLLARNPAAKSSMDIDATPPLPYLKPQLFASDAGTVEFKKPTPPATNPKKRSVPSPPVQDGPASNVTPRNLMNMFNKVKD